MKKVNILVISRSWILEELPQGELGDQHCTALSLVSEHSTTLQRTALHWVHPAVAVDARWPGGISPIWGLRIIHCCTTLPCSSGTFCISHHGCVLLYENGRHKKLTSMDDSADPMGLQYTLCSAAWDKACRWLNSTELCWIRTNKDDLGAT